MNRAFRKISDDFKRKVVLEVISGHLSKEAARRVYDVRGKSAINDWIHRFGHEFSQLENPEVGLRPMSEGKKTSSLEGLLSEIESLKKQLNEERHKAGLYRTMIEVAEETFEIEIRKKSGAKQSIDTKKK